MENSKIILRPNKIEEDRILELAEWIEKARLECAYPNYVIEKISFKIRMAWEDLEYRGKLCCTDLKTVQDALVEEYAIQGQYAELLEVKLEAIKEKLCPQVYEYFVRKIETEASFFKIHFAFLKADFEIEANKFQELAQDINVAYEHLCLWIDTLKPNELIDESGIKKIQYFKPRYVRDVYRTKCFRKKELKELQEELLRNNSIERMREWKKTVLENSLSFEKRFNEWSNKSEEVAVLYPNQERFYRELEKWASSIRNPCCREWISCYLERGRDLLFNRMRVFKFKGNVEKAKQFLLEQYERKLSKDLDEKKKRADRRVRIEKKREKKEARRFRKMLEKNGWVDCIDEFDDVEQSRMTKKNLYFEGYSGTWAHDVEGYSDDDIDAIFDGEPDAYWNID